MLKFPLVLALAILFVANYSSALEQTVKLRQRWRVIEKSDGIRMVAFSKDQQRLVTYAGGGRAVTIWRAATGDTEKTIVLTDGPVRAAATSDDGRWLFRADPKGAITALDLQKSDALAVEVGRHNEAVYVLATSPDGKSLASGDESGHVKVWDWPEKRRRYQKQAHRRRVYEMCFTAETLVSAGEEGEMKYEPKGDEQEDIIARDEATARNKSSVKIWDSATGELTLTINSEEFALQHVAQARAGAHLVTGDRGGRIAIWNAKTGKLARIWKAVERPASVYDVAITPDEKLIASSDFFGVKLWDAATGKLLHSEGKTPTITFQTFSPLCLAFSPDGRMLAVGEFNPGSGGAAVTMFDLVASKD